MNNDGKILIATPRQLKEVQFGTIRIGECDISIGQKVKNLGVIFDGELSMCQHVGLLCKSGFYLLRDTGQMCKYLTRDALPD